MVHEVNNEQEEGEAGDEQEMIKSDATIYSIRELDAFDFDEMNTQIQQLNLHPQKLNSRYSLQGSQQSNCMMDTCKDLSSDRVYGSQNKLLRSSRASSRD